MIRGLFFFFFFQAEDGIRDTSVTGVQTCALPISIEKSAIPCKEHVKSATFGPSNIKNLAEMQPFPFKSISLEAIAMELICENFRNAGKHSRGFYVYAW